MKKKILIIVDTWDWAIGTLAKAIVQHNVHYHWKLVSLHPRNLEAGDFDRKAIEDAIAWADIIDIQYWRTCSVLAGLVPQLKEKNIVLTHHNEKNLLSEDWSYVTKIIAKTKYSVDVLEKVYPGKVEYIPNSYNPDEFPYNDNYSPTEKIVGYVGRITPWKGLKEILKACHELGYKLMIMGKHDKMDYWHSIPEEYKEVIDWSYFNCDNSDKLNFYKDITIYVGNSGSNHEVGTLGFIEALAVGVPVVTSPAGLAKDIGKDGENMLMFDYGNYDEMKSKMQELMENPGLQMKLRNEGWQTIRNYNDEKMAWGYRRVYNDLLCEKDLVSVVIPATFEREENVKNIISAFEKSTYKDIELIICWDHEMQESVKDRYSARVLSDMFPVKHVFTNRNGYNLAMSRNLGVIQSDGEYIMFCDSRMEPAPDAIEKMMEKIDEKVWVFGEKGGGKKSFVENFSLISRREFIDAGMCNERINEYGGMSQELRERFASQGFKFEYQPEAIATQLCKSSMREKRSSIIRMKNLLYKIGF